MSISQMLTARFFHIGSRITTTRKGHTPAPDWPPWETGGAGKWRPETGGVGYALPHPRSAAAALAIRAPAVALRRLHATPRQGARSANRRDADRRSICWKTARASTIAKTLIAARPSAVRCFRARIPNTRSSAPRCRRPSSGCISGPAARSRSCGCRRANCATLRCLLRRYGARRLSICAISCWRRRRHQARFEILEQALLAELARGFEAHGAVGFALRRFMAAPHATTIAGVTDQIGLSPKRFIQIFRDETGFTPKVFCRIRRFQQALDLMEAASSVEWAKVALDCGYFDQAHFIHDFRAFSGINPTSYLAPPDAASQSRAAHRTEGPIFYNTAPAIRAHNGCMATK